MDVVLVMHLATYVFLCQGVMECQLRSGCLELGREGMDLT